MTSLTEVVFRLLFPLYLLFLLVMVIIVIRYTQFRLTRSPVPVLSTIIWLSYSSLFQTSVEILGVVPVTLHPSKDREARWLQGSHRGVCQRWSPRSVYHCSVTDDICARPTATVTPYSTYLILRGNLFHLVQNYHFFIIVHSLHI